MTDLTLRNGDGWQLVQGLKNSIDHFDPSAVSGRLGGRIAAGDDRRPTRFGECDVHGIVCGDVVSQPPRATQKIDVSVTVKIEVHEIRDRFVRSDGRDFTGPHETSKASNQFDVHEVRRVEFVFVAKEAGLDPCAKRRLQEKLQQADASATITPTRVPLG